MTRTVFIALAPNGDSYVGRHSCYSLEDGLSSTAAEIDGGEYRFFRVTVEMPKFRDK